MAVLKPRAVRVVPLCQSAACCGDDVAGPAQRAAAVAMLVIDMAGPLSSLRLVLTARECESVSLQANERYDAPATHLNLSIAMGVSSNARVHILME